MNILYDYVPMEGRDFPEDKKTLYARGMKVRIQ